MCGIFGIAVNKSNNISNQEFEKILNDHLFFRNQEEKRHLESHLKITMELVCLKAVFLQANL